MQSQKMAPARVRLVLANWELQSLELLRGAICQPKSRKRTMAAIVARVPRKNRMGKREGEDIELVEMGISEVRERLNAGWFIDLKTVLLLQHYFLAENTK